ncbi:MAG: hypothetical protein B6D64_00320 [Bacteroidetes bacterium 4484_276]|nr:MAG: hypothetical protein B6D64_00320 [Bacteroidetes bacterium 4484_276]
MRNFFALIIVFFLSINLSAQVHTTYLWHLQQPIYWPEQSQWDIPAYQPAWESHYLKNNSGNIYPDGKAHPLNNLEDIFNKDDRKAAYQFRTKDAVQTLLGLPDAGAQVNYPGCLIENVNSLAAAGKWGYGAGWQNDFVTARNWQTSGGQPRMDITGFTFHHSLAPLISEKVLKKEIQAHRYIYQQNFGTSPEYSKGFWPAECSFSERIIKVLVEEGLEWSVIANSHLARTLADYPLTYGTSGCNIDPPNGADKVSTVGANWWSGQIDGRGGTFAAPYCYQAHFAQYVDPETGEVFKITVVPMDDVLSYKNGYALMGTGEIDANIAPYDDPQHPSMVLLAHDGDNAWGGGYDYYQNSVPQFAQACASQGYVPTTIQQFLNNNPVPDNDVVRVEDGSWVNAANDWGHPQFINWLWPMYTSNYEFDPDGWTEDVRNWAVLTAAENHVQMAEDLTGNLNISDIVEPNASSPKAAKAWHHLLPGYTSGYMYYGTSLDMEVKQTLAANLAVGYADEVIDENAGVDNTPPTVFIPQRYPYNPGGIGFGPNYGYQQHQNSSDFTVWTFAYDVSGLQNVVLKYRVDEDGINPINDFANDTYAGGSGVGGWETLPMESRLFPDGNITNNPDIDFFILPQYMAYQCWAEISGLSDTLVDYYVEATDNYGNTFKTPIQHVYIGTDSSGSQDDVYWTPEGPNSQDVITIIVENATQGAKLHWGINGWNSPDEAYWPGGSYLFGGGGPAVESQMDGPNGQNQLIIQLGPFNLPVQEVTAVDFVIHFDDGTWDNNNGQDWHITISPAGESGVIAGAATSAITGGFLSGVEVTAFDGSNTFVGFSNSGITGEINYLLTEIPPGIYEVSCSMAGYQPQSISGIEVISGGEYSIVDFELELDTLLPPGWDIPNSPNTHSISIPLTANPMFEENPLNVGDFIGGFYLDDTQVEQCGGAIQWLGQDIVLTAFGDDTFTPEKDGFGDGELLIWKVYIQQEDAEMYAQVTYNQAMPNYDGKFYTNGLSQILSLDAVGASTQTFYIPQGWSGVSSYIDPFDGDVENIFSPFGTDFTILASTTGYYYPASGVNTIGNWDFHTGYKIKAEDNFEMNMEGVPISGPEVVLNSGWNLSPVLTPCEASTFELFNNIPEVTIIKEVAGTQIYWPYFNITTLTGLEPGKAYWILASEATQFTYPDCLENTFTPELPVQTPNITPWNDVHCTPLSHIISIPQRVMVSAGLLPADVIGVFTEGGLCAGSIEIENIYKSAAVVAFADDETTEIKDGFTINDPLIFKVFRPGENEEMAMPVEFGPGMPDQGVFVPNGISSIKSASLVPDNIDVPAIIDFDIFPNPSNGKFTIFYNNSSDISFIEILNISGKVIHTVVPGRIINGKIDLRPEGIISGIYIIKIYTAKTVGVKKIVVH